MKVSIIVPIFNAEKTLVKMLDSIQFQTFRDFEVIMINDGSTDSSGIICDEYVAKDSRFLVIHKKNEGVAMTRQLGIENAQGEYSIHCDADDWVESSMLKEMLNCAETTSADVVLADYFTTNNQVMRQEPKSLEPQQLLRDIFRGRVFGALWHKLVRTELYRKYNVQFFEGINFCEDVLIWAQILQYEKVRVTYLNKAFYHYMISTNSITQNITRQSYDMRCAYYQRLESTLPSIGFEREKRNVRLGVLVEGFMNRVISNGEVWRGLMLHNKRAAFFETDSLRWRMGYLSLALGLFNIAKKILKY